MPNMLSQVTLEMKFMALGLWHLKKNTDWPDIGMVEQRSNFLHSTSQFFVVIIQFQ